MNPLWFPLAAVVVPLVAAWCGWVLNLAVAVLWGGWCDD